MLAAEQLGVSHARAHSPAPSSARGLAAARRQFENVRVAIALAEIGRDELASEVLLHQARIGDAGQL